MMNNKAIFTILYGDSYIDAWRKLCEPGWRAYADKHGYDIVIVDKPIIQSADYPDRPIHWQKLVACSHSKAAEYEHIIMMDSDIMINYHQAPCMVEMQHTDKVGAVSFNHYIEDNFNYYKIFIRQNKFKQYQDRRRRLQVTPGRFLLSGPDFSEIYSVYTDETDLPLINTGVLYMQPHKHRAYMEQVFHDSFTDVADPAVKGNYEQEYLAFRLLKDDMFYRLDERFNRIAYYEQAIHYPFLFMVNDPALWKMCMTTILANAWFLHFAGNAELMKITEQNEYGDLAIVGLPDVFKHDIEVIKNRCQKKHKMEVTS